jgi:CubicO group peptidase (beta-lactamase class C family)
VAFSSCSKEIINLKEYNYSKPIEKNDNIEVRNISEYNIDTVTLHKLNTDLIDESVYNVHSVLIYKDGFLFYEKYLRGADERHGKKLGIIEHNINTLHDVRSISKSVVSACVGIAIEKGLIKNINERLENYFPELCRNNDRKSRITIKNLLTMSSGLDWEEIGKHNRLLNDETKMDLSFNPIKFILDKKVVSEPGDNWNYSAGNTQLLAEIIYKVSGRNIYEFATEYLFEPLGIKATQWVNLKVKKIPAAASGLRLTSRDLLKIGILYKDNGLFNNDQVISSGWIENSMTTHIKRPDLTNLKLKNGGYGLQFWTYEFEVKNRMLKIVEAKGNGGQSIFICRELNLVVVITAGNYGKSEHNDTPYRILKDYVLFSML